METDRLAPAARGAAPTPGLPRPGRGLLVALVAVLVLRGLQLVALAVASSAQLASGPRTQDGTPFDYYVFEPSPAGAGLEHVLANWDGQWYQRIATIGYPQAADVTSANDAWASAFPPGFPLVTRVVTEVTGLPFAWAGFVVSTVCSLLAVVLLHGLLRPRAGERVAAAAAVGTALLPGSPVLGVAYSEALALVLVLLALRLLLAHRYLPCSLAVLALALTRPVAVAFLAVVVVHAVLRLRREGRLAAPAWAGLAVAAAISAVSPWVWPKLAAALYGVPDLTQFVGASRTDQIASSLFSGYVGTAWSLGGPGVLALFVVVVGAALGGTSLLALRLGWPVEVIVWGVAYLGMVLVATPVTPGFVRYLVLAAPFLTVLLAAPAARPGRWRTMVLAGLVVGCLLAQWFWVRYLFVLDPAPALYPWAP